ncbi:MAG: DNA-binding protein [Alphaproteobacteria bacterium]
MALQVPDNPEALLTRDQTAAALTASGFPTKPKTLATKATRGGGPPYRLYCGRALYRWSDVIAWARTQLSEPQRSTAEADAQPAAA